MATPWVQCLKGGTYINLNEMLGKLAYSYIFKQ